MIGGEIAGGTTFINGRSNRSKIYSDLVLNGNSNHIKGDTIINVGLDTNFSGYITVINGSTKHWLL